LQANTGAVRWHYQTTVTNLSLTESNRIIYAAGSNLTSGSGIVYALKASDGSVLWHTDTESAGLAEPVVSNGIVYVVSTLTGSIYTLGANNGSKMWKLDINNAKVGVPNLQVVNDTLYAAGIDDHVVYALSATQGTPRWMYYASQPVLTSLHVYGDSVYVVGSSVDGSESTLYALNAITGRIRWRYSPGKNRLSAPTFVDGNLYMSASNGSIYSLRASDGSVAWHTSIGSSGIIGAPVVDGDNLYIANADTGTVYALAGRDGTQTWHASSGEIDPYVATVANNTVYIVALASGKIEALQASDGSKRWQADVSGGSIGSQASSPLVAGGMVYVEDNGAVYALQDSNGAQRWHYTTNASNPGINFPMIVG